jgi:hypothetical protein
MIMRRTWLRAVLVLLTSGLMVAGVGVSAASAHQATGDWRGNDTLCRASWCVRNGNLVRFWQAIVYADHPTLGTSFVDGGFGPNTHTYTVWWQQQNGLDDDGEVGPNTWGRANSRKGPAYPIRDENGVTWRYHYYGRYATVAMRQNASTGTWEFKNPANNTWTTTGH